MRLKSFLVFLLSPLLGAFQFCPTPLKPLRKQEKIISSSVFLSFGEAEEEKKSSSVRFLEDEGGEAAAAEVVEEGGEAAAEVFSVGMGSPNNKAPGWDLFVVVFLVYFLQGALALARLATTYYLKDDLQMSAAEVAALQGLFVAPWVVKPIYGFLSDTVPLFGYRRKSYLGLSGIVGCLSFLAMASFPGSKAVFLGSNVVAAASVAFADVVADSVVVERSRDDEVSARLQSVSWASRYAGSIVASLLSGVALEQLGARGCWLATSPLPLLVAVAGLAIEEERTSKKDAVDVFLSEAAKSQLTKLWAALTSDEVFRPAIFIFLWQSTPTCASAFFYFSTGSAADGGLGFDPDFLGKASAIGSVAGMVGIAAYNAFFSKARLSSIIATTATLSAIIGCLPLVLIYGLNKDYGVPDKFFAIGDGVVQQALGDVGFIPILVIAAKVCPPGIEGSLFAALMSIYNLGILTSQELGAGLTALFGVTKTNFTNLGPLVVICSFSSMLPLLALDWVRQVENKSAEKEALGDEERESLNGQPTSKSSKSRNKGD